MLSFGNNEHPIVTEAWQRLQVFTYKPTYKELKDLIVAYSNEAMNDVGLKE